jgi:23S rRNA pseudouridine1911/1915/1917 synthase
VAGDAVYGRPTKLVSRQFLHAWRLTLRHPVDGREMAFEAPLAEDLQVGLSSIR